jgi:phosphatidylethanolamine/phosphatidyl-N-methylethanolamine N-methyltransferase
MSSPNLLFLRRFLRDPVRVASVTPSSRYLASAVVSGVELRSGDTVIELGPGTGALTAALHGAIAANSGLHYLGIERDAVLVAHLQQRFPDLDFIIGDAGRLAHIARDAAITRARLLVCGVPMILFDQRERVALMDACVDQLADDGAFRAISYIHSWPSRGAREMRALLRSRFRHSRVSAIVWRNVPPALVLEASSPLRA